jgi:SAM-dependent methyltransferase
MDEVGKADAPDLLTGYRAVDAQPDTTLLMRGMDTVAGWPAVRQLRAWERERLALAQGDRLLDVGCGPGNVVIELSAAVAPTGSALGLDVSDAMIEQGRIRARTSGAAVEFRVADAQSLPLATGTVDACRSERMLQWVRDIDQAASELVRVLRPGGRLVVTDTDWCSTTLDLPDQELVGSVLQAMQAARGPGFRVGAHLLNLFRDHGLVDMAVTAATHVWTAWDPDAGPDVTGFFPIRHIIPQLAGAGLLDRGTADRFVTELESAARRDRIFMSLTMYSVFGRKPAAGDF